MQAYGKSPPHELLVAISPLANQVDCLEGKDGDGDGDTESNKCPQNEGAVDRIFDKSSQKKSEPRKGCNEPHISHPLAAHAEKLAKKALRRGSVREDSGHQRQPLMGREFALTFLLRRIWRSDGTTLVSCSLRSV